MKRQANPKDAVLAREAFKTQVIKCYLERHLPKELRAPDAINSELWNVLFISHDAETEKQILQFSITNYFTHSQGM